MQPQISIQDVRKVKNSKVLENGDGLCECAKPHYYGISSKKTLNHAVSRHRNLSNPVYIWVPAIVIFFLYLLTVIKIHDIIISKSIFKMPSIFFPKKSNFFLKLVPVFQIATAQQPQGLRANFFQNFVPILVPKIFLYIYKESFLG